jgi:hypothetical protein
MKTLFSKPVNVSERVRRDFIAPSHAGFSTIEILIAFAVGIIFLTAAMMVAFSDPTLARQISLDSGQTAALDAALDDSGLNRAANKIGRAIEELTRNWNYSGAAIQNDATAISSLVTYANTASVVDISPCVKEVVNKTTWNTLNSRDRYITFGTAISDMDVAQALGPGGCDPTPPGDWDNPENPDWETHPNEIDGTQSSLDIATINGTPYVFMTTTHTSQQDDLWVIDVSDVENPIVVESLETGGDNAHKFGLNDIKVINTNGSTYAYVLQNSKDNQLQTIDLSNPSALPAPISTISFSAYGVDPAGTNPQGKVITHYDGKLYIGLYTTIGPELLVFDIKNNPANPQFIGAIANGFDHSINDIVVQGNYAYLAIKPANPPSGNNTKELMIIDVSGSTPINTNTGYNASLSANDTEAATTLYLLGNKLYMGRERTSNASERDFYVFDITTPTAPSVLKSKRLGISAAGSLGTPRVIDLIVQGKIGFFVTTDSVKPFQIFDVVTNPNDITVINGDCPNYVNLPKLIKIVYKDKLIYGANGNQAALNILHDNPDACTP